MGKKVNPVSILIIVIAIVGLVCGGLLIFNERVPEGLIVIGCSVILTALPSLMKPAEQSNSEVQPKSKTKVKAKKSDTVTIRDVENASILCKCTGRCRIGDASGQECMLRITETSVEFLLMSGKMLASALRTNISDVKHANSHTLTMSMKNVGDVKFVSNDTGSLAFINQLLCRAA